MVQETASETHEQQLSRLKAEVEALRNQLRQAQRLATVGTMTAMVAHEFNNILTPIINYAQMARTNPSLMAKAVARAADGGRRASDICQAILGMTRGQDRQNRTVRMADVVAMTLSAMAREPRKDCIELALDIPPTLEISTRPVELQQVLLNMLVNARAAVLAKQGLRRIELSARRQDDAVTIRIADNGVGIAPENLQRIFQPFFSTKDPAVDSSQGFGLGLAICNEIIRDMQGHISVESAPGEGTTFTIRIPA